MADLVDMAENDLLRRQLRHLKGESVTMLPGSWDKTFINDVFGKDIATLTENQRNQVRRLAYKYRRQMPRELIPERVHTPRSGGAR